MKLKELLEYCSPEFWAKLTFMGQTHKSAICATYGSLCRLTPVNHQIFIFFECHSSMKPALVLSVFFQLPLCFKLFFYPSLFSSWLKNRRCPHFQRLICLNAFLNGPGLQRWTSSLVKLQRAMSSLSLDRPCRPIIKL